MLQNKLLIKTFNEKWKSTDWVAQGIANIHNFLLYSQHTL